MSVEDILKNMKIGIRDVIWLITLVGSLLGTYFTMNHRTDNLEKEVHDLHTEMQEGNLQLLQYDINHLKDDVNVLIKENKEWHKKLDDLLYEDYGY